MIVGTLVHVSRPNLLILKLHLYVVIFQIKKYVASINLMQRSHIYN